MAQEERAWVLISRSVSGEISAAEAEELEMIFLALPHLRADFENIKKLRTTVPGAISTEERRAMDRGLEKFDQSLNNESGFADKPLFNNGRLEPLPHSNRKSWMLAASIISILMIGFWAKYYTKPADNQVQQQVIVTPNGKRVRTTLPDGSTVWLNAASTIKFAGNLNDAGKRDVYLTGEAYFDVKHDAARPFIVHAGKMNVVVLGTAFNVKAYAADKFIETTLIRGKVEIMNENNPTSNIVLYPNQKVTINTSVNTVKKAVILHKAIVKDSVITSPEKVAEAAVLPDAAIDETAWLSNRLSFKQRNFDDIAVQLERWYNVKIIFDNDKYNAKQFTGTFTNQSITEVMQAFRETYPFHYSITNNQIHIW